MLTSDFDYDLPEELVAQQPAALRSGSRLLVLNRSHRSTLRTTFDQLQNHLQPGDLLVLNNSRVIPARLRAFKPGSGGQVEVLLLEPAPTGGWWALLRPGKRVRPGSRLHLGAPPANPTPIDVAEKNAEGHCRVVFPPSVDVLAYAASHGEMPLPPYIDRSGPDPADSERYQTVYARQPGSVAAPTAGLHFTPGLLDQLRAAGFGFAEVTLHVGIGTFAPVKTDRLGDHPMHSERYEIPSEAAHTINTARRTGRRVVAVGTTSLRVIESSARQHAGVVAPGPGRTSLFLHPPADFLVTDALLTNFHLPRSTLLMLVSAFASPGALHGRDMVLAAYREAIEHRFRFFSYGDAMLIR